MVNMLLLPRRLGMMSIIICAFLGATTSLFSQERDYHAERVVLDDDAGDGTRNTLTLQVPVTGLTSNWALTFPDAGGTITTSAAPLTADQILFGNAAGQIDQSANLLWTNSSSTFSIGGGLFTVDGTNGNVVAAGTIQSGNSIIIDGTTPGSHSISTTGSEDLTIAPGGGDLAITGNVSMTGDLDIGSGNFTVTAATGATTIVGIGGTANVRMGSLSSDAVATVYTPTATDGIVVADNNGDLLKRSVESIVGTSAWALIGNSGTIPGTHFLGTLDSTTMEIRVNNATAMRYLPDPTSPMVLGGVIDNIIDSGAAGSVIAGGGSSAEPNLIDTAATYSAIGGGSAHFLSGDYAVIGGGHSNAVADNSTAATIGGGDSNVVYGGADRSVIGGGSLNVINNLSLNATIAGGDFNSVTDGATYGTIGGGSRNIVTSVSYGTIGGGDSNEVCFGATYGMIGGGFGNMVTGSAEYSFVGGGRFNTVANSSSGGTIGGGDSNTITDGAPYAAIAGGSRNLVSTGGDYGFIGAGDSNEVSSGASYSMIGSGFGNLVNSSSQYAAIVGGETNTISNGSSYAAIGGGASNLITNSGGFGVIGGGDSNTVTNGSSNGVIGGGTANLIDAADYGIVDGGYSNQVSFGADYSAIGGGNDNLISNGGQYSTIGGGDGNVVTDGATNATIGGGAGHLINNSGNYSTISGGSNNTVTNGAEYATIGGGLDNLVSNSGDASVIAGGDSNTITDGSTYSAIGGGTRNEIGGMSYGTISGGDSNEIASGASYSAIGGGNGNLVNNSSTYATIGGGRINRISNGGIRSTIAGGDSNVVTDGSTYAAIGGGYANVVTSGGSYGAIGGGTGNSISNSASYSAIGGGRVNTITNGGARSTIAGGDSNTVTNGGTYGAIGGGTRNRVDAATYGAIGGGDSNQVSFGANYGSINGGYGNLISNSGTYSSIGGGRLNTITNGSIQGTIAGGDSNTIINGANYGAIGGGYGHTITSGSTYGAIGGGSGNTITNASDYSAIGGGQNNLVDSSSTAGVIGGGADNNVYGAYSVVPGGNGMTLDGPRNFGFNANDASSAAPMSIIDSNVVVFGNADLWLANNTSNASELRFYESNASTGDFPAGTNYTSFQAGAQSADITYTLPTAAPAADGDILTSTTAGAMSWADPSAITITSITGTANQVLANATSGTPQTGDVTLTLPQDIATTSTPAFGGMTLNGNLVVTGTSDLQGAVANSTGNLNLNDNVDVTGNIVASGTIQSGSSIVVDGTTPGSHNISTSGSEDLTIAPGGGDLAVTGNANVTANADIDGNLNVDGNTVHVGTLDQQGAVANSTGDLAVNDNLGVTGNADIDGTLNVDGSAAFNDAVSLGDASGDAVTLNGTLAGLGNGHSLGTVGTDATVITIQGLAGGASEFVVAGDAEINGALSATSFALSGNLDMNGNDIVDVDDLQFSQATSDISNTAGSVLVADDFEIQGNVINIGSLDNQGPISNSIGDVTFNDQISVNSDGGTNLFIVETGFDRNSGVAETISFDNNGAGTIEVVINGDASVTGSVDIDTDLNVDGNTVHIGTLDQQGAVSNSTGDMVVNDNLNATGNTDLDGTLNADGASTLNGAVALGDAAADAITLNGTLTGTGSGHSLGTAATDATVLTIEGADGGADELDVNGDANVSGTLTAGTLGLTGNLDMNGNDIVDVDDLQFSQATSDISNTAGSVLVADDFEIQGNVINIGSLDNQGSISNSIGDVTFNDQISVNSDGGTNLFIVETGFDRNSGVAETISFDNNGAGTIEVVVNGDASVTGNVDIDTDLNADGVTTLGGATAVTNSRLIVDDGHWTSQQTTAPSAAVAGANVTSVTLSNETDVAGFIDITSSGTPAAGAQATVTFDAAYNTAPIVNLTPANGAGAGIGAYVTRTTAGFTVNFIGVPASSTSYQFFYQVIETQ